MERTEVIKALECCAKDDCDNCPNGFGNCYSNLAGDALSLIKELTEKIKDLTETVKVRGEAIEELQFLATEIEEDNRKLTEENERLRDECGNQSTLWRQRFESIYETAKDTVKVDTLRELQIRLTREVGTYLSISIMKVSDMFKLIDQIAEEIIGETNDHS